MKKILVSLKNNKYISLFFAFMLTFAYMGGTRKYIYDNCSKIFSFERMGSAWFNLSAGIAVLMAVAVGLGVALMYLFRKKIRMNHVIFGYGLAGVISILALIFTPYNLQLLSPTTHMDAFATVSLFAVMFFGLLITVILGASISAHVLLAIKEEKLVALIVVGVSVVFATIFALLTVVLDWSLQIYLGTLTLLLIIFNIVNALTKSERENNISVNEATINWVYVGIAITIFVVAMIATLTTCGVIVESRIVF